MTNAGIAQRIEQRDSTSSVAGSNPAARATNAAKALTLYIVAPRSQSCGCVVAAFGSEHALDILTELGFDWAHFPNVTVRSIQRNIGGKPGLFWVDDMRVHDGFREHPTP